MRRTNGSLYRGDGIMIDFELPQIKYSVQKGLVSIIVPIYNVKEEDFRKCLNSILMQTFTNWEAILVNDGSTDNTETIIDEYVKKDSRFIAVHKQNEGTLLARKTGLENSRGEFIANIDHDDIYHPQFLQKMYAKITETNVDFVWCEHRSTNDRHDDPATDYEWNAKAPKNILMILRPSCGVTCFTWDKLIKRELYAKVYFPDINLVLGEDPTQILQVAYHAKSAAFISETLYSHKLTESSSSNSLGKNPIHCIRAALIVNGILESLFNGIVPQDVKNAFYCRFNVAYDYFLLNKEQRIGFKNELELLLPYFMKVEKKIGSKICLFFACIGFETPFKLRERIKKMIRGKI